MLYEEGGRGPSPVAFEPVATKNCYLNSHSIGHTSSVVQNFEISPGLTLYAPCIVLQYVYKPTGWTEFLRLDFIFYWMFYMFRTILVHHQEQLL